MSAVFAEIEGQMQGEAQLDDAEVAGEVGGADAEDAHQLVAHFLGELGELGVGEALQVGGRPDLRQECGHCCQPRINTVVSGQWSVVSQQDRNAPSDLAQAPWVVLTTDR